MMPAANNFGVIRLALATAVIISHSPELIDGDRSHEIVTQIFHTKSLGELAVDGFFLVSGYLITKSFIEGRSYAAYFRKRCLRIFPAFIVNFLICAFVIAPIAGAGLAVFSRRKIFDLLLQLMQISGPSVQGVFLGLHMPALNAALWSISYEFRCYIAVVLVGAAGGFRPERRMILVAGVIGLLCWNATGVLHGVRIHFEYLFGRLEYLIKFLDIFGVGSLYYLYVPKQRFRAGGLLRRCSSVYACSTNIRPKPRGPSVEGICYSGWLLACRLLPVNLPPNMTCHMAFISTVGLSRAVSYIFFMSEALPC